MSLKDKIILDRVPQHIAIIMDGNGRWAKSQGKARVFGHKSGVNSVRTITEACGEIGVKYLTLYAFSTENWNRPKLEVTALMELLVHSIKSEMKDLNKNGVRLLAIGNLGNLPKRVHKTLMDAIEQTQNNSRINLVLALSYSGRSEITEMVRHIANDVRLNNVKPEDINEAFIEKYLFTHSIPDPELLIRTSGELRISNFLLWQLAYTELYMTQKFWPEFDKEALYEAIIDYQKRERRFGKTSEQISAQS